MGEACVFNVKQINNPVNNEAVNDDASSEIKIVAGTKNVTVLNAAGKRLILRNILGQVIMNTIIVSNNESIPAPSGMLIITVENENSFKTIVK